MPLATFDPAKYVINIGGANMSGFADGTFINVERDEDTFNKSTGSDGLTTRVKTNNFAGFVTLTLMKTSPSNDILMAFALLDETANVGIVPVSIKDLLGTEAAFSPSGWVRKPPSLENSKEAANREWVLDCADLSVFAGGNPLFQG